jgi:3-carboxy-cis,cis-muconate cycloisomerase
MAAAHERPAGLWHGEWHALPTLFGLASGALREARALAEGLEVHPDRMRANLGATRGLLFADAAAGRLAAGLGREAAHHLVETAANEVRTSGRSLPEVLGGMTDVPVEEAFDLAPSVAAAALWTDRALAAARPVRARLQDSSRTR